VKVLLGGKRQPERRFTARLLWEPRDLWVGMFWNHAHADAPRTSDQTFSGQRDRFLLVYVSLVPCLPLALAWRTTSPAPKPGAPESASRGAPLSAQTEGARDE
jgi:hypothetical protein